MDSLTQIVLGAAVGEVVLGKKIGNRAIFWGAVAGTIPDLDVLLNLIVSDKMTAMLMHRAFSHSFLFAFLMAPIFGYLLSKIFKRSKATFRDWTLLFFWGLLTHILLDVQTTYGTQLLWPFTNRFAIGNIFVADPLYTVPFLLFVITVMFFKRSNPKRAKINKIGLYISTGYLVLTLLVKAYTYQVFTKNLSLQNIKFNRIETGTTPLNAILWYANVETDGDYYIGYYSIFDKDKNIKFKKYDKNFELRNKLKDYRNFKRMNHFSKNWYVLSQKEGEIYYDNIRFGTNGFRYEDRDFFMTKRIHFVDNDIEFIRKTKNSKVDLSNITFFQKVVYFFEQVKPFINRIIDRAKGNK